MFEDLNGNGAYETDTDHLLATSDITDAPGAEEVIDLSVDMDNQVMFRDNRIFAFIDNANTANPGQTLFEFTDDGNIL